MNGPDPLSFRILGKTCVIILPPTIDGVPPANDAAREEPRNLSLTGAGIRLVRRVVPACPARART